MILFLIQWLGGVYCQKKEAPWDDSWEPWISSIFFGWFYIIVYIIDHFSSNSTSTSNSSSETATATEQPMTASDNILNEAKTITGYQSYMEVLKQYYIQYGEEMFLPSKIESFIAEYQLDSKYDMKLDDIVSDLEEIKKAINTTSNQAQTVSDDISTEPEAVNDYDSYMELLRQYYSQYGEEAFLPSKIQDFIASNQLNSQMDIKLDDVMNDLLKISRTAYVTPEQTVTPPTQPQDTQKQTISTTPPVQTQSILDTQTLFDYIKDMPIKWEYANPNLSPSKDLQQLCNTFLTDMEIPKCYSRDVIMNMEYIIQKKRARTPNKEEYNKVMERNILFELFKYSYYMNFFKVLEDRKNDKVDVDKTELANLIREDCIKRFGNMEYEKRKTPAIQSVLQKYESDTQGVKMIVNDYVEPREYDYIYASLMTLTLLNIVNFVLYSELKIDNGYQPTIQIVKKYPANDLITALDTYLASFINLALNMYTSGGILPTRPQ